jgi:hypothetical protein
VTKLGIPSDDGGHGDGDGDSTGQPGMGRAGVREQESPRRALQPIQALNLFGPYLVSHTRTLHRIE